MTSGRPAAGSGPRRAWLPTPILFLAALLEEGAVAGGAVAAMMLPARSVTADEACTAAAKCTPDVFCSPGSESGALVPASRSTRTVFTDAVARYNRARA